MHLNMDPQIKEILDDLLEFRRERDWEQFHSPKNLAISISIEAAELLELFQWLECHEILQPEKKKQAAEEIADIFIYLILISHGLGVDLIEAAKRKILDNAEKYPVSKSRGTAKKYKEF